MDPEFKLQKAMTQLTGGLLIQFADSPLLKMDVMLYADALNQSLNSLKETYNDKLQNHQKSMGHLEDAVKQFRETAKKFMDARYTKNHL